MARVLSENTYQRMMTSISTTEGLAGPSRAPSVRRVRSVGGGGSPIITLRINTKINGTNYGCDIVDNRRDKNITTPYDPNKKNILWLDNEPAWDLQAGDYYSAVLIEGANGSIAGTYQTVGSIFLRN